MSTITKFDAYQVKYTISALEDACRINPAKTPSEADEKTLERSYHLCRNLYTDRNDLLKTREFQTSGIAGMLELLSWYEPSRRSFHKLVTMLQKYEDQTLEAKEELQASGCSGFMCAHRDAEDKSLF